MFKKMITKNMERKRLKMLAMIALVVMLLGILATTAYAQVQQAQSDLFEPENYYKNYSEPKDGVFSLTYVGLGCPAVGDLTDHRFRINVSYSSIYTDWKFYSNNSTYQRLPTGRLFNGYDLNTANGYVCIGTREFWPFGSWTNAGVQQNVYVWRK
jgi:hypothetical protein